MPFVPRVCRVCSKTKGTMCFRWWVNEKAYRDYFHPACFKKFRLTEYTI